MIFEISHWTEYRYSEQVQISKHLLHLQPRDLEYQKVLASSLEFVPTPTGLSEHLDYFGNRVAAFHIAEPHVGLHITCRSSVEVKRRDIPSPARTPAWESVRADCDEEAGEFLYPSPNVSFSPEVSAWAVASFPAGRPVLEGAMDLTSRIAGEFLFDKTATTVSTPLVEVFRDKRGVCQDFAHLQIACFRSIGIPARYVSGYVRTFPPPGQQKPLGGDASHAWVSIFVPGFGWVDLDPTNNRIAGEDYVTIGWGRDYSDVSLIRGVLSGGGEHSLFLSVNVEAVG